MTNITENPAWAPVVDQIDITDQVLGGPDGVINIQAKQLADRTAYLKQQVETAGATAGQADTKADQALAQIDAIEIASGAAADNAMAALNHKQAAQAAQALAEQARNAAQAASAQAGDNASYAAEAAGTAQLKAAEAQSGATAAVSASGSALAHRTAAETARGQAQAAQAGAEVAQTGAQAAKSLADAARIASESASGAAASSASAADADRIAAEASAAAAASTVASLQAIGGGALVGNTPAGGISATTVQGAINELDSEKVANTNLAAPSGTSLVGGTWFGGVVATLAALATSIGSSLLGFIQAGIGAVQRSIESKLRENVSVLDFGAIADGNSSTGLGTDNSPFFQAALDYAFLNSCAVYVPHGTYVLRSQVTIKSQVRIYGAGMYMTMLIAPTSFTGDGLIKTVGAGGPPTIIEHMATLGQTSGGAGAGSIGVNTTVNAVILQHLWIGGFATQFGIGGTDVRCTDCFADVSLSAGYGFAVTNGGNSLIDCTVFGCYTGIYVSAAGYWSTYEPDIGVQITNCNIIQCGYSGIDLVSAINTVITNVNIHTPTSTKFTRDFVNISGGRNISLNQVTGTFGNDISSSCSGIRQVGETWNLQISNCSVNGAQTGFQIGNIADSSMIGNSATYNQRWGFEIQSGSYGLLFSNNKAGFNGGINTSGYGNFRLVNSASSGNWVVSNNSSMDFNDTSQYGFGITADATETVKINLIGNVCSRCTTPYSLSGTVSNIVQTANI